MLHEVDDDYDDDDDDDDVLVKVAPVEFTSTFELKNDVQYCTAPCSLLFEVDSHINVQLHSRDGSTYHLHRVAVASLESRTKDHRTKQEAQLPQRNSASAAHMDGGGGFGPPAHSPSTLSGYTVTGAIAPTNF